MSDISFTINADIDQAEAVLRQIGKALPTTMPSDYTLIAGILGQYLGDHPELDDEVSEAIIRLATDLENAGVVDGRVFWGAAWRQRWPREYM